MGRAPSTRIFCYVQLPSFLSAQQYFLRTEFCCPQTAASSVTLAPMTTKTRLPPQGRSYIRKSTGCQMILYFSFSFAVLNSVGEKRNLSVTGQKTLSPLLSISRTFYSISKDTLAPPPVFTLILTISVQKQLTAGHSTAPLLISSMMS